MISAVVKMASGMDQPSILILDLPPSALVGIDLLSFTATPRFLGIRGLPPGWHFVFVAASTASSERHGVWFYTYASSRLQFVARWDPNTETLVLDADTLNPRPQIKRWRDKLPSIWEQHLAPYRQNPDPDTQPDHHRDWPSLVSGLFSFALIDRLTRGCDDKAWTLSTSSTTEADLDEIPGLDANHVDHARRPELDLLPIDLKHTWPPGATGRERTEAAQDRSWALHSLVAAHCTSANPFELPGELNFCFLMVLTLNNFSALEQWKRLLTLCLTCVAAVFELPHLFARLIEVLRRQLQHCDVAEAGLIDLSDESDNLLKPLLVRFRKGLQTRDAPAKVQGVLDELGRLEAFLRERHGWTFGAAYARSGVLELEDGERVRMDTTAFDAEQEAGEFAPVLVELSREERRALGLDADGTGSDRPEGLVLNEDGKTAQTRGGSEDQDEQLEEMDSRY